MQADCFEREIVFVSLRYSVQNFLVKSKYSGKVMAKTNPKETSRLKRIMRIRKKISGTADCPRLRVFRSTKHIYGQLIDDVAGHTIVAASTLDKEIAGVAKDGGKKSLAHKVGVILAEKAKKEGIEKVVFDRGGFLYHGRIKSFSDGAREGGLKF